MNSYVGHLVVLRSVWRLQANRIGIVVEQIAENCDKLLVMWTTKDGIELKIHVQDALIPVSMLSYNKLKERICVFK